MNIYESTNSYPRHLHSCCLVRHRSNLRQRLWQKPRPIHPKNQLVQTTPHMATMAHRSDAGCCASLVDGRPTHGVCCNSRILLVWSRTIRRRFTRYPKAIARTIPTAGTVQIRNSVLQHRLKHQKTSKYHSTVAYIAGMLGFAIKEALGGTNSRSRSKGVNFGCLFLLSFFYHYELPQRQPEHKNVFPLQLFRILSRY
jgi:hypothetical protein